MKVQILAIGLAIHACADETKITDSKHSKLPQEQTQEDPSEAEDNLDLTGTKAENATHVKDKSIVAIVAKFRTSDNKHARGYCSGLAIDQQHVVTSASCLQLYTNPTTTLGSASATILPDSLKFYIFAPYENTIAGLNFSFSQDFFHGRIKIASTDNDSYIRSDGWIPFQVSCPHTSSGNIDTMQDIKVSSSFNFCGASNRQGTKDDIAVISLSEQIFNQNIFPNYTDLTDQDGIFKNFPSAQPLKSQIPSTMKRFGFGAEFKEHIFAKKFAPAKRNGTYTGSGQFAKDFDSNGVILTNQAGYNSANQTKSCAADIGGPIFNNSTQANRKLLGIAVSPLNSCSTEANYIFIGQNDVWNFLTTVKNSPLPTNPIINRLTLNYLQGNIRIASGRNVDVRWETSHTSSCSLFKNGEAIQNTPTATNISANEAGFSINITEQGIHTITLSCNGLAGNNRIIERSVQLEVTPPAPTITSFKLNGAEGDFQESNRKFGVGLSWTSTGAINCDLQTAVFSGNSTERNVGRNKNNYSRIIDMRGNTDPSVAFTLFCSNEYGTTSLRRTVHLP